MKKLLFFVFFMVFLMGCTPQQRLNRLLTRHPELINPIYKDTILTKIVSDTIYVPSREIDTFFSDKIDSFFVEDSGVQVIITKYVDKWRVRTFVKSDTIMYRDTIKIVYKDQINQFVNKSISNEDKWKYRQQGIYGFLFFIFILIIIMLILLLFRNKIYNVFPFLKIFR